MIIFVYEESSLNTVSSYEKMLSSYIRKKYVKRTFP